MVSYVALITGAFELLVGCFWLGSIIHKPPADQPPRVFIGRVLMPLAGLFIGVSMLMQQATMQTALPALIGLVLAVVALFLQLRYRPERV